MHVPKFWYTAKALGSFSEADYSCCFQIFMLLFKACKLTNVRNYIKRSAPKSQVLTFHCKLNIDETARFQFNILKHLQLQYTEYTLSFHYILTPI